MLDTVAKHQLNGVEPAAVNGAECEFPFAETIHEMWLGDGIATRIYLKPWESIPEAGKRTIETLAGRLHHTPSTALMFGSASASRQAAMHLVKNLQAKVVCLQSPQRNSEPDGAFIRTSRLEEQFIVLEGSVEDIPLADSTFDVVWSQDAFLSTRNLGEVFEGIERVLVPGGELMITDPLRPIDLEHDEDEALLSHLGVTSLVSLDQYNEFAERAGLESVKMVELPMQLAIHYHRLFDELQARRKQVAAKFPESVIDQMLSTLLHWVEAARHGMITWGVLHFQKPLRK